MNESKTEVAYRYWRRRIMWAMVIGYGGFYFVRKNISVTAKSITDEFSFSNTQWGMVLSAATIVYAFSKFFSGIVADRVNPKYMMSIGLFASALLNLAFGLGNSLTFFLIIWALNNLFQGMGMPPCSRLLTSWFSHRDLGKSWGIWNASHQIGGAIIMIWAGYLVSHSGWRSAFFWPGLAAIVIAIWIYKRLVDTPESLGLPSVEEFSGDAPLSPEATLGFWEGMQKHIIKNPWVWLVSLANFFIYIVRIGIMDWAPKYLEESKGFHIFEAGFIVALFEVAGIFGAYASGYLSDGLFKGFRGRVSVIFMGLLIASVAVLFMIPSGAVMAMSVVFVLIGFFVYGPQMLVAVAAADYASKVAAATAVGLTGLFGYLGATVCSLVTGFLVDQFGWDAAIYFYVASAICGTGLLAITWNQSLQKSKGSV